MLAISKFTNGNLMPGKKKKNPKTKQQQQKNNNKNLQYLFLGQKHYSISICPLIPDFKSIVLKYLIVSTQFSFTINKKNLLLL